jgi:hypothetical protein
VAAKALKTPFLKGMATRLPGGGGGGGGRLWFVAHICLN